MKHIATSTALALVFALAPGAAWAATQGSFESADANRDSNLTQDEFEQVSRDTFDAWNTNQDDRLTENEVYGGIFAAWDQDQDQQLSETEYQDGVQSWFQDQALPSWNEINADGDDDLTQQEFAEGVRQSGELANLGGSAEGVDWETFHVALFDLYDRDDTGDLAQDEYQRLALVDIMPAAGTEGESAGTTGAVQAPEVISLTDWRIDDYYPRGFSVDNMMDDMEVYGRGGEEIGSIENVIFSDDGRVLSIIAEVGGFWDMFDTHVSVPWDQVEVSAEGRIAIPVTEDNVDDYSVLKSEYLVASDAASSVEVVEDDLTLGPRAFRATELIGDYARIRSGGDFVNYGYVQDLIIQDGQLQSVVVSPDTTYGVRGPYAYPYAGRGWAPGAGYYDMPYDREQVVEADRVVYDRLGYN